MIAPEFRIAEQTKLLTPTKNFVCANYGDGLWKDLEPYVQQAEATRNSLGSVKDFKSDSVQLEKFKGEFMTNYHNMNAFSKYFSFGTLKTNLNVTFTWRDSIKNSKQSSNQPLLDSISSLYNYAICLARQACYGELAGDGIKVASKNFQQAAWLFEHLQTLVTQLPAGESSAEFTTEALTMNSNLCLAQA